MGNFSKKTCRVKPFFFIILITLLWSYQVYSKDLCGGNTYRCELLKDCSINKIVKDCAYGSSGAAYGSLIFSHGRFYLEWQSEKRIKVTYGKKEEFTSWANVTRTKTHMILSLENGVVLKYPHRTQ